MAFVVIDTETTGLPYLFNKKATRETLTNWDPCRMIQLAWMIYNDSKELVSSPCYLVIPDGFTIPISATKIHGITNAFATENGLPIDQVLKLFQMDLKLHNVKTVVAHNIDFDYNVILSEMYRCSFNRIYWRSLDTYCTMRSNIAAFGGRFPRLNMLYAKMVGPIDKSVVLHTADADCKLCAEIYLATSQ